MTKQTLRYKTAVERFIYILDQLTVEVGKDIWLEKTPRHFYCIYFIKRYVPVPHFIHILRDGRDVVASIYDRAMTYDKFHRHRDTGYAIRLWNDSIRISSHFVGQPNHIFVTYENLVKQTSTVLEAICKDIGIDYSPRMTRCSSSAEHLIPDEQPWIKNALNAPRISSSKFDRLFDEDLKHLISKSLRLDLYEEVKRSISYG